MPQALPLLAAFAQAASWTYAAVGLTALYVGISVHNQRKAANAQQQAYRDSLQDRHVTVRSSSAVQRIVYGRQRVGGDCVIAAFNHATNKKRVTLIIPVAPHPIDGFEEIWLNDVMDPVSNLDGSSSTSGGGGWVTESSAWSVNVTQPFTKEIAGGTPGSTVDLGDELIPPLAVSAVVWEGMASEGSFERTEQTLFLGVDFSISGRILTWITNQSAHPRIVVNGTHVVGTPVVRVKLFLGQEAGERDTDLETETAGQWTSTDLLCGIARMHLTLEWNQEKFGQIGIPNASAVIRGALLWNPIDGQTRWSRNAAHAVIDYLTREEGYGRTQDAIDLWPAITAAMISDELVPSEVVTFDSFEDRVLIPDQYLGVGDPVRFWTNGTLPAPLNDSTIYYIRSVVNRTAGLYTLSATTPGGSLLNMTSIGSGVHRILESRYTCDTMLSTDADLGENLRILMGAMAGNIAKVAGKIRIKAGAFEAPVYTLDEDDLAGDEEAEWVIEPETPNRELFNGVRGTYVDASDAGKWAVTSYPPYLSSTYVAQDLGQIRYQDIPLPATIGRHRAQRIAKLTLHLARLSLRTFAPFNVRASPIEQMDTIHLPFPTVGWHTFNAGAGKIFRVEEVVRNPNGIVNLTLREEAEQVYDWDFNEATGDPAPNTALPDPNFVEPIEGLALATSADTYEVIEGGRIRPYGLFSWQAVAEDSAIRRGGRIVLRWKHAIDLQWQQLTIDPDDTEVRAYGLQSGATVIATIQAFNAVQAPSELRTGVFGVSAALRANEVRASGNLIPDATFASDVRQQWHTGKHPAMMTDGVLFQKDPAIVGPPSSAILFQGGVQPYYVLAYTDPIPVVGGVRYWAYCQVVPHRCNAYVQVTWLDVNGAVLGLNNGNIVASTELDPRIEANYSYADTVFSAPANAVSVIFQIVSLGTLSGANSGIYALKPFIGPVDAGQTERPAWNSGVAPTVGTMQIGAGATYELQVIEQASPVSLPPGAVQVTPSSGTFGPYPVDTQVILTAECVVTYGNLTSGAPRSGPIFSLACNVDGVNLPLVSKDGSYSMSQDTAPVIAMNNIAYANKPRCRVVVDLAAGRTLSSARLLAQTPRSGATFLDTGTTNITGGTLTVEVTKLSKPR